ncbi:hypothetical protein RJI07_05980 [Mycoplasmatota bacterium WC30]
MNSIILKRIIFLFIIGILVSVFVACDYNTPTKIYTDDENGLVEFENEFEIQLLSTDYAEDSSWLEYHFTFELKKEYTKKFGITIDDFKIREGDKYFQLSVGQSLGYISSYNEVITIKLDGVEQDEIYQYLDMNITYLIDIQIDSEPLQTSCELSASFGTKCENFTSYENGIRLSFDGRSIWFGDLDYLG